MLKQIFYPQFCKNCQSESDLPLCNVCLKKELSLSLLRSNYNCTDIEEVFYFKEFRGIIREIIKIGKYKFNQKIWKTIAEKMSDSMVLKRKAIITFVPMTWGRFCYRGFNQAKILGQTIAFGQNLPLLKLLKRTKFHGSLTQLSKIKRQKEIQEAFVAPTNYPKISSAVKTCYLIDDVYTSGATLNSAAKAIKARYPKLRIIGICFAKTRKIYE